MIACLADAADAVALVKPQFEAEAKSMTGESTVAELEALGVKALGYEQAAVVAPTATAPMFQASLTVPNMIWSNLLG